MSDFFAWSMTVGMWRLLAAGSWLIWLGTAEFVFLFRPNSGAVTFARALFSCLIVYGSALALINVLDPKRANVFDIEELQRQIIDTLPWFGTILAAFYAAFYARFSAQWRYIADLYNQIKMVEATTRFEGTDDPRRRALVEWKAGFIEDAEDLHLATKSSFASVIYFWAQDQKVAEEFEAATTGGQARFDQLMERVERVYKQPKAVTTHQSAGVAAPRRKRKRWWIGKQSDSENS